MEPSDAELVARVVQRAEIPERTLKRRFKAATGASLIERLQDLRIEQAKRLLEAGAIPVDEISFSVGYEDASFFRRLFKRRTSLTPSQYRRMFKPILNAAISLRRRRRHRQRGDRRIHSTVQVPRRQRRSL